MFNTLFLFFTRKRSFRQIREIFLSLWSACFRKMLRIKPALREDIATPRSLMIISLRKLGLVFLIAIAIQISGIFDSDLVDWLSDLLSWLKQRDVAITNDFDYGTLLASIIGVGGVFIGLYYAAISSVCSAIYANKPNNIRNLLAQDRVSSSYMDWLVRITEFGVFFLALNTLGVQPSMLAMLLLLLGAGWMIFGFIQLGRRAFNLFDPTTLADSIFITLKNCSSKMVVSGYHWSDTELQSEAHRQSQIALDTLTTLSDITAEAKNLNGSPFAELCKRLISFLCNYETRRKLIPTESLWYRQQYEHPDWYRAGDTETSFAYETSAGLPPKIVRDSRWIESSILPNVKRCLEINLIEKRYVIVNELLSHLDDYIQQIAGEHQVEFAVNQLSDMFTWCEKIIFVDEGKIVDKESLEHMEICKMLASMSINVLESYVDATESYYGQNAIHHHLHDIRWASEKSIYKAGFAEHVLEEIEKLRPKLEFEKKVEGKIISEPWYIQKLMTQQEAKNISTAITCFYEIVPKLYEHWIEIAKSYRHPWLEATIISRETEYWNKLDCYTPFLYQFWNELNQMRNTEITMSKFDINILKEKKNQREKELLKLMSEETVLLSLLSRPKSYPDFAGQFLHTVGEALLNNMCKKDCEMVKTLFNRYFGVCLLEFQKLRPKEIVADWQALNNMKIAAALLLDLIDISGYAYLLSEYHDEPLLKEPIEQTWGTYLNEESGNQRLQFLAASVSLTESSIETAHRSINRHRWKQILQKLLRNVERKEVPHIPSSRISIPSEPDTIPVHKSPLVRIFAWDADFSFYDGIDIFIAKYIRNCESGEDLDFGWRRHKDLREDIQRESQLDAENMKA